MILIERLLKELANKHEKENKMKYSVDLKTGVVTVPTKEARVMLILIRDQARMHYKVKITYRKKSTDNLIHRTINPYEYKNGMIFAEGDTHKSNTDKNGNSRRVRGYLLDRIVEVEETTKRFKPMWDIKL